MSFKQRMIRLRKGIAPKVKQYRKWREDHMMARKLLVSGTLLFIMVGLLLGTMIVPRASRYADSKLNSDQSMGDNASAQVHMTSKAYNAEKDFMVVGFRVSDSNGSPISEKNIRFEVKTMGRQAVTYQAVPLVDNHFIVVLSGLKPGFQAVQLTVLNKQVDTSTLNADSTSASESSDGTTSGGNSASFIINEKQSLINNKLTKKTQKQYVIDDLNGAIQQNEKKIKNLRANIKAYQSQAVTDQSEMKQAKKDAQYTVNQDNASDKISSAQSDYQQQQDNIKEAQKSIQRKQKQIKLYQKEIRDVRSGKYKLPNSFQTGRLK